MIYLDSAATSFRKPRSVARAVARAMETLSSPGRGGYESAMLASDTLLECRLALQRLFHVPEAEGVVFTLNATHALNIAIRSLVPPGGRAVISGWEHNAVTRPLHALRAELRVARGRLFDDAAFLEDWERALGEGADAAVCTQVSNVFGWALPLREAAERCRERGVPLIVDASQGAGVLPLNCEGFSLAYAAMPGHKGLMGPQGTGVLLCGEGQMPEPILQGGTGSLSRQQDMPDFLPDRLEAGTHNVPGIAGLLAGVEFVEEIGLGAIREHEQALCRQAAEGLAAIPGVEVFRGPEQMGVLSFRHRDIPAETLGDALARRGIALRAGLHCAPLAHENAGTLETGTLRASFSLFNRGEEAEAFCQAVEAVCREKS